MGLNRGGGAPSRQQHHHRRAEWLVPAVVESTGGPGAAARRATLNELVDGLTLAPFDSGSAEVYARARAKMEQKGQAIGPLDLLIAAQALSRGLVLVTDNLREFRRVPDLVCENWLG